MVYKNGEIDVMTPRELTKQAFKLYDDIRIVSYTMPKPSDYMMRLHSLRTRAFYRYKRRLKAE
jgi:hypothetical protein